MEQGTNSLIQGLAEGLNGYLGTKQKYDMAASAEQSKQAGELKNKLLEQQNQSTLDINKQSTIDKNKSALEDILTPDMAEKVLPGAGAKMVQDYNSQNPNRPLKLKDGVDYLKQAADALNPDTSANAKHQDTLEKQYADRLTKVVQARTGGLGLQDSKVNQAVDLRTLVNQYYDPKTKEYNIPPAQHSELALGLARLLSPQGTVPIELEKQIRQSTGREAIAKALIYAGMDPAQTGGPTQSVIKMFVDSIDRQGSTAEKIRDKYIHGLKDMAPTGLEQNRIDKLNKANLTTSYNDTLSNSPDHQAIVAEHPVGKVLMTNPDGQVGYLPAGQVDAALKSGWKQGK